MQIAIPAETGESRVAATPETVKKFIAMGHTVVVQSGAGFDSAVLDSGYVDAGASIAASRADAFKDADIVLAVRPLDEAAIAELKQGA
ncbi:MAG: NAD(P)(+) transhydrogenase (Re/Si-specific) subunit alpha, partial [Craterilacuibacter sp.]